MMTVPDEKGHARYGEVIHNDEDAKAELRRAWADTMCHVLIPTPPTTALYRDGQHHA